MGHFHLNSKSRWMGVAVNVILTLLVFSGAFLMLEYSCIYGFSDWSAFFDALNVQYILLNFVVLGCVWSILLLLCARIWLADLILSVICGVIAIINHYVLVFHGMPLSFLVIKNLATAMNVMSGYDLSVDTCVIQLLLGMGLLAGLCLLVKFIIASPQRHSFRYLMRNIAIAMVFFVGFGICFLGEDPVKPAKTITWQWKDGYNKYGYAACTVESYFQMHNIVNKPDGYTEAAVREINIERNRPQAPQTPDVILILNESLYDPKQIIDLQTDIPYFQEIHALENLVSGYAVTPSVGGGTNSSEYELLTSNSLELMPGITPFNALDFHDANSIVSFMKSQGYYTIASHIATASNYSRSVAYPALGFDQSFFADDFENPEYYYNRRRTDQSAYNNLIRWYEAAPEDAPKFLYMLTYQNHGAYNQNDPEHDLVHVNQDYGEYTQPLNEFLTSISLSSQAFSRLADYFSQVERPVIICMVGDHSPDFAKSIVSEDYKKEERNLRLRTVPLFYWANFEMNDVRFDTVSMNQVIPLLLELAGMNRSPYYDYLIQLRQNVPVLSSYGRYFDNDGNLYKYDTDEDSPFRTMVDQYFNLEYYNLQTNRNDPLYNPYP